MVPMKNVYLSTLTMRGSGKFCQRGPNQLFKRKPNTNVPIEAGHHQPASETPFKCRFAGGPIISSH